MQLWFPVVIPLDQINIKVAEFQSFSCAVVYILFLFRELDLELVDSLACGTRALVGTLDLRQPGPGPLPYTKTTSSNLQKVSAAFSFCERYRP